MVVAMEDAIDALIAELVQPLLSFNMVAAPSISQQQDVAKQMHAAVLLYNYYYRKQCPDLDFQSFESSCKISVIANQHLLPYLSKHASKSENLSIVEQAIMRACDVSSTLFESDERAVGTWPVEKAAVFLCDGERERCFLERDTVVKGVFSLMEMEIEGKEDEDALERLVLSKVENQTGISRANLRIWYSRQTYSLSKERSRTTVFLMGCSKPPAADKGLVEVPIKDVHDNLKGPIFSCELKPEPTQVVGFFLLLPYADIISDLLSKSASELQKEIDKRTEKRAKSIKIFPTNTDDPLIQIKKEPISNGSVKESKRNGHGNPVPPPENNNPVKKHVTSNVVQLKTGNGSMKMVKVREEGGDIKRENVNGSKVGKGVKQQTGNASKEIVKVSLKPSTPTKRPIIETPVKQEIVPFGIKDFPSCLLRLTKIRDDLCKRQMKLEDKVAQCENDIQTIICGGKMTSEVEKIVERWEKSILSDDQLDVSFVCPNINKKKKLKLRSTCQQLDDNCRDNNLPLPRYNVHSVSNGSYMAYVTLKSKDIDCVVKSDMKKSPHEAREHGAMLLMKQLHEMDED